ncbi:MULTISPECIES: hypothetical protein [Sphingomonas]|uniref:hypothetical protein n=1 Tax=Sphingomonas TaxID=13687 RepID=UPI00082B3AAE|nr:hypothetical protein [Sphingomonas sp. CCH10-B3]
MSARVRDVIDVNRRWDVFVGSRLGVAYWHGSVLAADAALARQTARSRWQQTRIGFVEEQAL